MSSVFKREFRALFLGRVGWICLIGLALAAGILTTTYNFLSLSSDASRMFPVLSELLIVFCPLLAAHTVTYETQNGNWRWLRALPVSRMGLLTGKYLAMLALMGVAAVYFALFPLLIGTMGNVSYGTAYTALLGWFLIAAAVLALCTLIASLVRVRWQAILFGILACAVAYCLPLLAAVIVAIPWVGMLLLVLVGAGVALPCAIRDVRASRVPMRAMLIFAPVAALAVLFFFLVPGVYRSVLPAVLEWLSPFGWLDGFRNGHLDVAGVVALISITVLCLLIADLLLARGERKGGGRNAKANEN